MSDLPASPARTVLDELYEQLGEQADTPVPVDLVGSVGIRLRVQDPVSYAVIQAGVPLVRSLKLGNVSEMTLPEASVTVSLRCAVTTAIAGRAESTIPPLEPGAGVQFKDIVIAPDPAALVVLEEAVPGEITVEVSIGGAVVASKSVTTRILAYNEFFNSDNQLELIAAHVLPNHPAVTPILQQASAILQQRTGSSSLEGYQSGPKRAIQIADAIFEALRSHRIVYINPPASFEESGQKIRTPDQVLGERLGTCIDLACTYCACLEQAGLSPAMYFIHGHAYAGIFTNEDAANTLGPALDAHDAVVSFEDAGHLVPVEATGFSAGKDLSFAEAVVLGKRHLKEADTLKALVNISGARKVQIRPLPAKVVRDGQVTVIVQEAAAPVPIQLSAPRSAADVPRGAKVDQSPARVRKWKSELLDLSLRNPMLNMSTRNIGLGLLPADGSLGLLEDMLARGDAIKLLAHDELTELHRRKGARTAADVGREERTRLLAETGVLFADCEDSRLRTRLRALMSKARSAQEESGTNVLHLALGSLHWTDPKSERAARSPVLLLPVNLRSAGRGKPVELVIDQTGVATHNYCLLQKLRNTFDLTVPELEQLRADDSGVDVNVAIAGLRRAIADNRLVMRVDEDAVLGPFQFGKFRMWKDLEDHWETFLRNPVVRHIVERPGETFADAVPLPAIEELETETSYCPIPCDGAQLEAVVAAGRGCSFVLEGPPGTGKSQTITNLIANALAAGKRVLFVAEKRAALDVVKRRLEAVGLGSFCLDIHGKDSGPQKLREQLLKSLEAHHSADIERWSAQRAELRQHSGMLQRYVRDLHEPLPIGLSAWTAQQRLLELGDGPALSVAFELLQASADTLRQLTRAVAELPEAANAAGWKRPHPWQLSGIATVDVIDRSAIARSLAVLDEAVKRLDDMPAPAAITSLLNASRTTQELRAVADVLRMLADGHQLTMQGIEGFASSPWRKSLDDAQGVLAAYQQRLQPLLKVFAPTLLETNVESSLADAKRARDSFFLFRKGRLKAVIAGLSSHARATGPTPDNIVALLEQACEARRQLEATRAAVMQVAGLQLPSSWMPYQLDASEVVSEIAKRLSVAAPLLAIDEGRPLAQVIERSSVIEPNLPERLYALAEAFEALRSVLSSTDARLELWRGERGLCPAIRSTLSAWNAEASTGSFIGLGRFIRMRLLLETATTLGLPSLGEEIEAGRLAPSSAPAAFARGLARTVLRERLKSNGLVAFDALEHNRLVARVAALTDDDGAQLRDVVPHQLLETRPFRAGQRFGEVGELARNELARQKGGLSIRALLRKYSRATVQLTPCLLMSPDSVAQFLEPGVIDFDLVVFDEASQVPVSNAIGAMGRGKAVVVVGDSRQMPPTAFFTGTSDDQQAERAIPLDAAAEDLESILSECVASGLNKLWLSWHYRSQDEALIAFSNSRYYESRLASFPAALSTAPGRGVSWVKVDDGIFDRGASRTNRREAEVIVDLVQQRLRDPKLAGASIGIVTLNLEQCDLVTSILEDRSGADTALEACLRNEDPGERLFVKNLESVQGDERDVILLSVGFAKDSDGMFSMNFGPLNRSGGERRWNVAVTRARQQVIIVSSIDPEDIVDSRIGVGATGVRHLKAYLEFARGGQMRDGDIASRTTHDVDRHREEIAKELRSAGLHVETNVGLSAFKVDLAVSRMDEPSKRLVAILLDGPGYASRRTVQDRDALPPNVLKKLMGWPAIVRIWLPEWLLERERVVREIRETVSIASANGAISRAPSPASVTDFLVPPLVSTSSPEAARVRGALDPHAQAAVWSTPFEAKQLSSTRPAAAVPQPTPTILPKASPTPPSAAARKTARARDPEDLDFKPYTNVKPLGDRAVLDFSNPLADRALVQRAIAEVMAIEAPIEVRRLAKLVARRFGLQRVTEQRLQAVLSCLPKELVRRTEIGSFAWNEGQPPTAWTAFRRTPEGCDRSYEDIPPQELRNAMLYLTRKGMSMSDEGMVEDLAEIFRVSRITSGFRERVTWALTVVVKAGQLRREGDRILLP